MKWENTRVLITGGLGFIGSNLNWALLERGATVTIVDNFLPGHGGNPFNLEGALDRVVLNIADINDRHAMNHLVRGQQVVFHLAGQVNHLESIRDPFGDATINVLGTLSVLEACRSYNPEAKLVFAGTRGQYGASVRLPVDEDHPTNPRGVYAVTNLAAEQLVRVYHRMHGLDAICLRITNTFGPRHQMQHSQCGVVNWFIRLAMERRPITVMGDGSIKRDLLFVEDLVAALLRVVDCDSAWGEVMNVGSGRATTFLELAEAVTSAAGGGTIAQVPFNEERLQLEPGDYVADVKKIASLTGWTAEVALEEGLSRTIAFYREHWTRYWGPAMPPILWPAAHGRAAVAA